MLQFESNFHVFMSVYMKSLHILSLYITWEPKNGKSCSRKLVFTYSLFTLDSELLFKSFSELLLAAFIQHWKHTDHFTHNMKNILCPENLIMD